MSLQQFNNQRSGLMKALASVLYTEKAISPLKKMADGKRSHSLREINSTERIIFFVHHKSHSLPLVLQQQVLL